MIITKNIYQEKETPFQSLDITVNYCTKSRIVEEIVSISAYEFGKESIDISEIMMKYFENDLNKLIDSIDWAEVAAEYESEKREFISDLEPTLYKTKIPIHE